MEHDNSKNTEGVYSKKIRAGRRRTYFFDVRTTRSGDYFLTITESKKRFNEDGYERHKIFLYKEDFNKFIEAMNETVNYVKTELMPNYNFDEFSHKEGEHDEDHDHHENHDGHEHHNHQPVENEEIADSSSTNGDSAASATATATSDDDLKW